MTAIAHITVGQAATLINACITIVQYTVGVALVIFLVYIMRNANPAISWSSVSRTLHSSYWPDLLRADSASSEGDDVRVRTVSILTTMTTILLVVSSIITPLGLKNGPLVLSSYSPTNTVYIKDSSPIGQATPPRDLYTYGRMCGALGFIASKLVPCPGNGDDSNTTAIAASIIETFSSTPYGPFNMQFRRYYLGQDHNYSMTSSSISLTQSFILHDDIFAVDGLVVDLTTNPGVGLWNHTLPAVDVGGTWSTDVLWLEPQTSCVNTNLTIDYALGESPYEGVDTWNLTDRGAIANLSTPSIEYPLDGQDIDLYAHAYKGAWLANNYIMTSLGNLTRNESYVGKTFQNTHITVGSMQFLSSSSLLSSSHSGSGYSPSVITDILCEGYSSADTANITNVAVHCAFLLGPPQRTDGGDPRIPAGNSTWTQDLYVCASATRAKMQNITFAFNGTSDLSDLDISRKDSNGTAGLWAMEKSYINITDVDLFWGRVDDSYENNPNLSTTRSDEFYIPAGGSDHWGVIAAGQPTTVVGAAWSTVYNELGTFDYSGNYNYALLNKWQLALQSDPSNGAAFICNSIWTDLVANNLVGNDTSTMMMFAKYQPSIVYDYVYGIPAFLLLLVWTPIILVALFALVSRGVRLSYLRFLLNQTSVGRIVLGDSALKAAGPANPDQSASQLPVLPMASPVTPTTIPPQRPALGTSQWTKSVGKNSVVIKGSQGGNNGLGEDEEKSDDDNVFLRQKRLTAALASWLSLKETVSRSP